MRINQLLQEAVEKGASDLHISAGLPPVLRLHGELVPMEGPPLQAHETAALAGQILTDELHRQAFHSKGEVDFAYSYPEVGRFRVNVYRQRGNTGLAMRVLQSKVPELGQLGMPEVVAQLARRQKGLILVTGPTGSGKSTTLAAMIRQINRERSCHILTLEDPIEYLHLHERSMINQREIGQDSAGFSAALRAALRQDPDVILVGEMRDLETIAIAITAAETGHLVLATLHTMDAPQTIDRVIDVFPPHQQQQIRVQLANTLIGVIAQRLLRRRGGVGRVAAVEVLVTNPAVRNLIREGKIYQVYSVMQTGARYGMQLMDEALRRLCESGAIDPETALENAADQESITKALGGSASGPAGPFTPARRPEAPYRQN